MTTLARIHGDLIVLRAFAQELSAANLRRLDRILEELAEMEEEQV